MSLPSKIAVRNGNFPSSINTISYSNNMNLLNNRNALSNCRDKNKYLLCNFSVPTERQTIITINRDRNESGQCYVISRMKIAKAWNVVLQQLQKFTEYQRTYRNSTQPHWKLVCFSETTSPRYLNGEFMRMLSATAFVPRLAKHCTKFAQLQTPFPSGVHWVSFLAMLEKLVLTWYRFLMFIHSYTHI